jgi:hypothetical protein
LIEENINNANTTIKKKLKMIKWMIIRNRVFQQTDNHIKNTIKRKVRKRMEEDNNLFSKRI